VGGIGGGFQSAKGSWEGLGLGNRRRRFPVGLSRFLQTSHLTWDFDNDAIERDLTVIK